MKKIASFTVNHDILERGMYLSRIDGDAVTYDIRMKKPNGGVYLENPVMHTIEHLFATYARNSRFAQNIIYFGPMGCRTGFYLIVRELSSKDTLTLIRETLESAINHQGEIPGAKPVECGNAAEHDLEGAKVQMANYYETIKELTIFDLQY